MPFFHYIINQKLNNFIKHRSPVYQEAADIRDVYLYKKLSVHVRSWYTGGGGRCSIDKIQRCVGLQHTKYKTS